MKTIHYASALATASLLMLAACGGGEQADALSTPQAANAATDTDTNAPGEARVRGLAASAGPAVGTLVLVSASAAGKASAGSTGPCAISADGGLVAFNADSATLVAGDTNQVNDVFLKNTRSGAISRVSTSSSGAQLPRGATCVGMTPDGNSVVLQTAGYAVGCAYCDPQPPVDPAILVKNLRTGALTVVTPALSTLPSTTDFVFQSISDDGLRVAMLTIPATRYLGGYLTVPLAPVHGLMRDLGNGSLINLASQVALQTAQGFADVNALALSPDGRKLAFTTRANVPATGDLNGKSDVFVLDLASRSTVLASSNSAGVQAVLSGPPAYDPAHGLLGFVAGGSTLAFVAPGDSTLGAAGAYFKNLNTGAIRSVWASGTTELPALSLSGDGNQAAFDRDIPNPTTQATPAVWVRNLLTGQETRVNTKASGVVGNNAARLAMISRDGSTVGFQSNATNLVSAARVSYIYEIFAKTVHAAAPGL